MRNSNTVPSFDLLPRDALCQCVALLRSKWQPQPLLGPVGRLPEAEGDVAGWRLPNQVERRDRVLRGIWQDWLERDGLPRLGAHALRAADRASRGGVKELRQLDRAFDRDWPAPARQRSRCGAAQLLASCDGLRHAGAVGRLRQDLAAGQSCHWVSAWAALGALFSLPPASISLGALFAEWEALDPIRRRRLGIGEAVAWFARDSGSPLARCEWMERRVRDSALRIA